MDTRLYILAGTFALVVLSLIVLVVSLVRARRAPLQALVPEPGPWPALMPAPANVIEMHAADSTPFTEPSGGIAAVLGEPLRTGSWQPATEPVARGDAPVDYWDSLIDDPALLVRPTAPRAPEPAPEPEPELAPEPTFELASEYDSGPAPEPAVEPTLEPAFEPAPELAPEPTLEPAFEPAPELAPEPTLEPAFEPLLESASEPEPEPAPVPALEPEPVYESPVVEIHADPTSDDLTEGDEWLATLVATLDDVGDASEVAPEVHVEPYPVLEPQPQPQPQPQPTPQQEPQPEPITASELPAVGIDTAPAAPATPMPVVLPTVPAEPMPVVSVPVAPVAPVAASVPAVPAPVIPAEGLDAVAAPKAPSSPPVRDVPEYVLVAPVEMWFGEARVGVKPGSRTYEQFQRYASVMFDDLKRSAGSR